MLEFGKLVFLPNGVRMPGRVLAVMAVLFLAVQSGSAGASPKTHEQATRQFFASSKMGEVFDAMAVQMTDVQIKSAPILVPFREPILTFLRKYMSWKELEPELVKIYMKEFSEGELKDMTKFYSTSTGRKVLHKMPELSAAGAAIGQAKLEAHAAEFQAILEEAQKKNEAAAQK